MFIHRYGPASDARSDGRSFGQKGARIEGEAGGWTELDDVRFVSSQEGLASPPPLKYRGGISR